MISQDVVLVRYGEITLKDSWTRQNWERILAGNIAFSLHRAGVEHKMERGEGRIFVHTSDLQGKRDCSTGFWSCLNQSCQDCGFGSGGDKPGSGRAGGLSQAEPLLPSGPGAQGSHSPANRSGGSWERRLELPQAPLWTWMSRNWRSLLRPGRIGPSSSPRL